MFDEKKRFVMKDYQRKPTFSSFLPGIAGPSGVPAWVYYNNRGQGVCSFGVSDKDHAIMEFSAAHNAYQNNARTGFRTFCRADGEYCELFTGKTDMYIGSGEMEIRWENDSLAASALYFGLPGERVGALVRILTVRNVSDRTVSLELLDGMPAVVCYGINQDSLKNMAQLSKAWMQAEDRESGCTCFRVRASMADSACVTQVEGVNFNLTMDEAGTLLNPIVQPELVFGEDTGLEKPEFFLQNDLETVCSTEQVTQNLFPCCFQPKSADLQPGEAVVLYELYGQAEDKSRLEALKEKISGPAWFEEKHAQAAALTEQLASAIATRTADSVFDGYCGQTYIDNLLRGGEPVFFRDGEKTVPFWLYSRKHGDPEREYNYFSTGREYFAQGNGNFRDVNQNRRSDVLFHPEVGDSCIRTFYELIQSDGCNPLVILPVTFRMEKAEAEKEAQCVPESFREEAVALLTSDFTPGHLAMSAEDWGMNPEERDAFTASCVCHAGSEPNANFGEGYWCDHWTYNLDLIESYLAIYPEKKEELLFGGEEYRWYASCAFVNPRAKRYERTEAGLRQYHALDESRKQNPGHKWMDTLDGKQARSTLMEKLLLLCAVKSSELDAAGMGIEMEGGKPGWYDALNGLPGLLGSSMAESCELARMLRFVREALEGREGTVAMYEEMAGLLAEISCIFAREEEPFARWDAASRCREAYRDATEHGVGGQKTEVPADVLVQQLSVLEKRVLEGIEKAVAIGGGICPTYFSFEAEEIEDTPEGPMPRKLVPTALPLFLEGPVRWLKLSLPVERKQALAEAVEKSPLYDQKLKMFKVNASLDDATFEIGRARAFTAGWLENESVWLHMEYKYLLELLKSGLYREFADAFHDAAVPFMDPEYYGRSPLENVSFIASSANPNPAYHGRGFVARLSGSTAEFLQMWQLMFFGAKPFSVGGNGLKLTLAPFIPEYLMPEDGTVQCTMLGNIAVTYHAPGKKELFPGEYTVSSLELSFADGTTRKVESSYVEGEDAQAVRSGKVVAIAVEIV